ncbi:PREDICTED: dirigent [Prunus dulcis]|uniref:Dirigent protein n=1 Tax=Prunus dulcis TaxID=3755 RepID=A0A5E4FVP5_PRUDU|nr:PREDICTED: dirigent [Prunus dulcis]
MKASGDFLPPRSDTRLGMPLKTLNSTITTFGATMMIDDALTEKQEPTSKIVGRAQGLSSVAAQRDHEFALLVVMNFAFVEGKYKGSTISILGRNPVLNDVREMPIIGGMGLFRFARGYALAHTVRFNPTGDANVKYNQGKYKGSNISVSWKESSSEQCIVGRNGQFRLDPDYVLDHTVWFDASTGDAIVESNVYVSH